MTIERDGLAAVRRVRRSAVYTFRGLAMGSIGAMEFWREYKRELQRTSNVELWKGSDALWTENCLRAAEAVMRTRNLQDRTDPSAAVVEGIQGWKTGREYFRIDVIGEIGFGDCDWTLEVAFEHENSRDDRWIQ